MRIKLGWVIILTLLLWSGLTALAWAEDELGAGKYYTMVDEKGMVIDYTGLKVSVGDEYISPDNSRYRVERVSGLTAHAQNLGKVNLLSGPMEFGTMASYPGNMWAMAKKPVVGIYSTHTDESYIPSDGKESIRGKGGIIKVASALTKGLSSKGIKAIRSGHDPVIINQA